MLRSMTGYAQARVEEEPFRLELTLKSVNHRYLDLHLRLPSELEALELKVRRAIQNRLRRGHVEVSVYLERTDVVPIAVNRSLIAGYVNLFRELRDEFGLAGEPDLMALLRFPGMINPAAATLREEERERLGTLLERGLEMALSRLGQMRLEEGKAVEAEFRLRVAVIRQRAVRLAGLAETARPAYATWLERRLKELLGSSPLDPTRLGQEAAILAERADVSEEIARLSSHLVQLEQLLESDGELGKKLDFLLQEMNRETNTILSKTPGLAQQGLEMTALGIELKAEIEKLREQVQNVE